MSITARFTPSLMPAEDLDALFVNREAELNSALDAIADARSGQLRHVLFVGPRGSGKTHLINVIHHRAQSMDGYGTTFTLALLAEDPWLIDSYDELTNAIDAARTPALDGPLTVVFVENLDVILHAMGETGQRRLRERIEGQRDLLLVATSTRLSASLLEQVEPFYGFFDVSPLDPFTPEQARVMLERIAGRERNSTLLARLRSPQARGRLATISYLAGGQPRIWSLLSAGMEADSVDDLVDVLLQRFDDLTPYFQSQMQGLSPNERRVVKALSDTGHAMTVRMLAEHTGIEQRSLGKTVTELKRKNWLRPRTGLLTKYIDKRVTYYELAEPLARLAFQLKESRGEPVRLVTEFLAEWFDTAELTGCEYDASVERYLARALEMQLLPERRITRAFSELAPQLNARVDEALIAECAALDDALAVFQQGDAQGILARPAPISHFVEHELRHSSPALLRLRVAGIAVCNGAGAQWLDRANDAMGTVPPSECARALLDLAGLRMMCSAPDAGIAALRDALGRDLSGLEEGDWDLAVAGLAALKEHPDSVIIAAVEALGANPVAVRGSSIISALTSERPEVGHRVIELGRAMLAESRAPWQRAFLLDSIGLQYGVLGLHADSVAVSVESVTILQENPDDQYLNGRCGALVLYRYASALAESGSIEDACTAMQECLVRFDADGDLVAGEEVSVRAFAEIKLAGYLMTLQRYSDAHAAAEKAVETTRPMDEDLHVFALNHLAAALIFLDRTAEADEVLAEITTLTPNDS